MDIEWGCEPIGVGVAGRNSCGGGGGGGGEMICCGGSGLMMHLNSSIGICWNVTNG